MKRLFATHSLQAIDRHRANAFDIDIVTPGETKFVFEKRLGRGGDLDRSRFGGFFHARGDIHDVAPEIIGKFAP